MLAHVERPSRYVGSEWGSAHAASAPDVPVAGASAIDAPAADVSAADAPAAGAAFCMVYPDTYELGQPNQALRILVNAVNRLDDVVAERGFLPAPDMADAMRAAGVSLFSIESCAPLREFEVVGITLPHELAATNVLEVLDLAGIALRACDRGEDDPIVIGGGPCAMNPEPYAPFFDALSIGEGEQAVPQIIETVRHMRAKGAARADIVRALAQVEGTYVPALYRELSADEAQVAGAWVVPVEEGVPATIVRRVYEDFAQSDAWEPCVVPYIEAVHDRLNVEVLRGCARGCRFCQAGMMYRPVRERSADNIVNAVLRGLDETGYDEVSLTSLSTTDHSQIEEILMRLNKACEGRGVRVSVPSQRLDAFGVNMAELVAGQKKGGLTFAPEAGTQRLRNIINKNVSEDDLFAAIEAACAAGWRRVKLYFMIGLPGETDDDVKGIASLAQRAYDRMKAHTPPDQRGALAMTVSVGLFVPKAQTPFQWDGQISREEALRRVGLLKRSVKYKAVRVSYHDPATSFVEAVMSRGSRACADMVEAAWRAGARFDAWTELFREDAWRTAAEQTGIDPERIAQVSYEPGYVLPWAHISAGVSQRFLALERARAQRGETTPDCTFGACTGCGVCQVTQVNTMLAAPRAVAHAVPSTDGAAVASSLDGADEAGAHE